VAGAGLCDEQVVRCLTEDAPGRLQSLIDTGARFDRDGTGQLDLTREGGHHRRRVAHAGGDATGAEVNRALIAALRATDVEVIERTALLDLAHTGGSGARQVTGVMALRSGGDVPETVHLQARCVVLATGGIGGVYAASTNPSAVTGDGLAIALRAGATVVDLEFVQFHPTALSVAGLTDQIPLVTEALRGEGAVLLDHAGRRIMAGQHPLADLAPRDVVARRIDEVMADATGDASRQVHLDATGLGERFLRQRFPTVYAVCRHYGINPGHEPIPVAPAQHFSCGGIRTDVWGATDVAGLYAVGEVAATGVHGANRLASNSLLEGMVFGRRVASRLSERLPRRVSGLVTAPAGLPAVAAGAIPAIRSLMSRHAGIRRDEAGLATAAAVLAAMVEPVAGPAPTFTRPTSYDAANRWTVAAAVVAAANARRESRGCHWRADFPTTSEQWRHHVEIRLDHTGRPAAVSNDRLEWSA
jgi:L-aspartate oxidase